MAVECELFCDEMQHIRRHGDISLRSCLSRKKTIVVLLLCAPGGFCSRRFVFAVTRVLCTNSIVILGLALWFAITVHSLF